MRPVALLEKLGLLDRSVLAAHCVMRARGLTTLDGAELLAATYAIGEKIARWRG